MRAIPAIPLAFTQKQGIEIVDRHAGLRHDLGVNLVVPDDDRIDVQVEFLQVRLVEKRCCIGPNQFCLRALFVDDFRKRAQPYIY